MAIMIGKKSITSFRWNKNIPVYKNKMIQSKYSKYPDCKIFLYAQFLTFINKKIVHCSLLSYHFTLSDMFVFIFIFFLKALLSKKVAHCKPKFERLHDTLLQFWKSILNLFNFFCYSCYPREKFCKRRTLCYTFWN